MNNSYAVLDFNQIQSVIIVSNSASAINVFFKPNNNLELVINEKGPVEFNYY